MDRLHYFNQNKAPDTDFMLDMAKQQGYVPSGCLLSGRAVMSEVNAGRDACAGCEGPRSKCGGRDKEGQT